MQKKRLVIALPIALLATVCVLAAPAGLGTVGGRVVNAKKQPVPDIHVTLQAAEGGLLQTTSTNQDGKFWFPSLPEGQYAVRASDREHVSEWRQDVWVAPGKETDVTLHLRAKASGPH